MSDTLEIFGVEYTGVTALVATDDNGNDLVYTRGGGGSVTQDQDGYIVLPSTGGGSPSATQHIIHLEFSDSTDTDIDVYYDDSLIGTMITAYKPKTYGQKTITLAQLDGVTWYEPVQIPIGVELVNFSTAIQGVYIGDDGEEYSNEWSWASDYILVDEEMTFSYTNSYWYYIGIYDENKHFLRSIYVYTDGTVDPNDGNTGHGTLSGNKLLGASYVRLCGGANTNNYMSLIRTA